MKSHLSIVAGTDVQPPLKVDAFIFIGAPDGLKIFHNNDQIDALTASDLLVALIKAHMRDPRLSDDFGLDIRRGPRGQISAEDYGDGA